MGTTFCPTFDRLGNALSDIHDEEPQGVTVPTGTFEAYQKATGVKVIVDDRTFDAATMSLTPVVVA